MRLALLSLLLLSSASLISLSQPPAPTRAGPDAIYPRTESGAPNPAITQSNIAQNICNKNWSTDSVRPPTSVTTPIKRAKMQTYGYTDTGLDYELDHLVSLQVGGCPACLENLWPEPYGDTSHHMTEVQRANWNHLHPGGAAVLPGSLEKDMVENYVHDEICFGLPNAKMSTYAKRFPPTVTIPLARGQQILASDWYACYQKMQQHQPCQ